MVHSVFRTARRLLPLQIRIFLLAMIRSITDILHRKDFAVQKFSAENNFPYCVYRHSAHLYRNYPEPWFSLQKNKVHNLAIAVARINRIVLQPGQIFSFWRQVGLPSKRKGYLPGMTVHKNGIGITTGGGLCQISNALYWCALHAGLTITERHRHSLDLFPDSRRDAPFAAGATVAYRSIDLRFVNPHTFAVRFEMSLDAEKLHVVVMSEKKLSTKYEIHEKNHRYVNENGTIYRENELWRICIRTGTEIQPELIAKNKGRILYSIPDSEIQQ